MTKILMLIAVPILIGLSVAFTHGNLITFSGVDLSGVSDLLNMFADSIRLICHLSDMFLVQGTAITLIYFWFGFTFAVNFYKYFSRFLEWIR